NRDRSRPNPMLGELGRRDPTGGAFAPDAPDAADGRDGRDAQVLMPSAGLPGWLVALTFVCIALFVAGLVVYLRRDGDATASGAAGGKLPRDAGGGVIVTDAQPEAPAPAPAPGPAPANDMVLVRKP